MTRNMPKMGTSQHDDSEWDRFSNTSTLSLPSASNDDEGDEAGRLNSPQGGQETEVETISSTTSQPSFNAELDAQCIADARTISNAASVLSDNSAADINEVNPDKDVDATIEFSSNLKDLPNHGTHDPMLAMRPTEGGKSVAGEVPLNCEAPASASVDMSLTRLNYVYAEQSRDFVSECEAVVEPSSGGQLAIVESTEPQSTSPSESPATHCLGCGDEHGELIAEHNLFHDLELAAKARVETDERGLHQHCKAPAPTNAIEMWKSEERLRLLEVKHALELKSYDFKIANLESINRELRLNINKQIQEHNISHVKQFFEFEGHKKAFVATVSKKNGEIVSLRAQLKAMSKLAKQKTEIPQKNNSEQTISEQSVNEIQEDAAKDTQSADLQAQNKKLFQDLKAQEVKLAGQQGLIAEQQRQLDAVFEHNDSEVVELIFKLDELRKEKVEVVQRNRDLKNQLDTVLGERQSLAQELISIQAQLKRASELSDQRLAREELLQEGTALGDYRQNATNELVFTNDRPEELKKLALDPEALLQFEQSNIDLSNVINNTNIQVNCLTEHYNDCDMKCAKPKAVAKGNEKLRAECASIVAREERERTACWRAELKKVIDAIRHDLGKAKVLIDEQRAQITSLNDHLGKANRTIDAAKENEKRSEAKKKANEQALNNHNHRIIVKFLHNTVDAMTVCYDKFDQYMKLSRTYSDAVFRLGSELDERREMQDCMGKVISCGVEQIKTLEAQIQDRDQRLFEAESHNIDSVGETELETYIHGLHEDGTIKANLVTTLQEEVVNLCKRSEGHGTFNLLEEMPDLEKLLKMSGHLQNTELSCLKLNDQCKILNRAADELHDDCIRIAQDLTDAMCELSDAKEEIDRYMNGLDRAKMDLSIMKAERNEARGQIDTARQKRDAAYTRLECYGSALLGAWQEMNELRHQLQDQEASTKSSDQKYNLLDTAHKELHTKYENISIERDSLDASFKAVHAQYEDLSNRYDTDVNTWRVHYELAETKRQEASRQKHGAEIMLSQLRHQQLVDASIKRAQLIKIEKKRQDAVKEVQDRNMRLEEYEVLLDNLLAQADKQATEIQLLKTRLANANERILASELGRKSARNSSPSSPSSAAAGGGAAPSALNVDMGVNGTQQAGQPISLLHLPPYSGYQTFRASSEDRPGPSTAMARAVSQNKREESILEHEGSPCYPDLTLYEDAYESVDCGFESHDQFGGHE